MIACITPAEIRRAHIVRSEIALLDVREEGAFALDHPLFAASLPLSRLELEAYDRLPRLGVTVALYDAGEGLVEKAAARLAALGYSDVRALDGGLEGWRQAGYELFQDVFSPSKSFGELVEMHCRTPSITAPELKRLIDDGTDLVILDARRFEEFQNMSIPGGVSVPGAELVLRAKAMAPDPATPIIVNCAGRTRSIIGAQSLINAGIPNPVRALRNGTIGWRLAGQTLHHGRAERFPEIDAETANQAAAIARGVSYRAGVRHIAMADLDAFAADADHTLYRFDVRTPEEFAAGHIPGFRSAPGGQLVQETDRFAPVRGARIVLADHLGARADMTASWLAQMGWTVFVLDGGFDATLETGPWRPRLPPLPHAETIDAAALARMIDWGEATIIDLAPSPVHARGHIPGAWFAVRSRMSQANDRLPQGKTRVLTSPDGVLARFAAEDFKSPDGSLPLVLAGGTEAWIAAGLPIETGTPRPTTSLDDVYRKPYERDGDQTPAMAAYIAWEHGLTAQLARDGSHGFFVI